MNLKGKTALVTGSTKRLGFEIAKALAEQGINIALHYRNHNIELKQALSTLDLYDVKVKAFKAELTSSKQISDLIDSVWKKFGTIDILINNAAIFEKKSFLELTEHDWDLTLNTNLKAPFLCSLKVGRRMLKQGNGKIINLACVGGIHPWAQYIPYSVSKAGVIMLTRALAKALKPHVQVNAIAPGKIDFEKMNLHSKDQSALYLGKPKDVTDAILYLLNSDFVTGDVLVVDGGHILN